MTARVLTPSTHSSLPKELDRDDVDQRCRSVHEVVEEQDDAEQLSVWSGRAASGRRQEPRLAAGRSR